MLYIISQVFGWTAAFFRAGGMFAKNPMTVKLLVSAGNLCFLINGIMENNLPLIASNAICLAAMIIELVRKEEIEYNSMEDAVNDTWLLKGYICGCCRGYYGRKTVGGRKWEYI